MTMQLPVDAPINGHTWSIHGTSNQTAFEIGISFIKNDLADLPYYIVPSEAQIQTVIDAIKDMMIDASPDGISAFTITHSFPTTESLETP